MTLYSKDFRIDGDTALSSKHSDFTVHDTQVGIASEQIYVQVRELIEIAQV